MVGASMYPIRTTFAPLFDGDRDRDRNGMGTGTTVVVSTLAATFATTDACSDARSDAYVIIDSETTTAYPPAE
jgi:hypothetical protein